MALKVKKKSSIAACIYSLTTRQITLRSNNNILEGDLGIFCLFKVSYRRKSRCTSESFPVGYA